MHTHRSWRRRAGFTVIEILMVVAIVGIVTSISVSRLRITPAMEVQLAGMQLAQDIDFVRTRALSTRSLARIAFSTSSPNRYTGYLDDDMNGTLSGNVAERVAMQGFGARDLPVRVIYGRGAAPAIPGDATSSAITFASSRAEFDSRGLVTPYGTSGVIYLRHSEKADKVVAVAVAASGNVRLWTYRDGAWQ